MASRKTVIDKSGEAADLSQLDKSELKPFTGQPALLQAKLRGRPKAAVTKERITIRLSADVVQTFRATHCCPGKVMHIRTQAGWC